MRNIDRIPFPHLMSGLSTYHPPHIKDKAMRVYEKCITAGKFGIAKRIRAKYLIRYNKKYDIAEAVGFSLFASQNPGK